MGGHWEGVEGGIEGQWVVMGMTDVEGWIEGQWMAMGMTDVVGGQG